MSETTHEAASPTEQRAESYAAAPQGDPQRPRPTLSPTLSDDPLRRSPFLAALLSVVPGIGHVYVGYTRLGFVHILVAAGTIAMLASGGLDDGLIALLSLFLGFFWLYGIVDAARRAMLVNQALLGRVDLDLPQTVGEPKLSGSVAGGVAVIALGSLLLANTLFDISLDWVEDWWPVAVIAFGAFLVYRAVQDRQGRDNGSGESAPIASESPADEG